MERFTAHLTGETQVVLPTTGSNIGAFNNGFQGICAVFVTAAFSFAGTELAGLAAAETVFHLRSISDEKGKSSTIRPTSM